LVLASAWVYYEKKIRGATKHHGAVRVLYIVGAIGGALFAAGKGLNRWLNYLSWRAEVRDCADQVGPKLIAIASSSENGAHATPLDAISETFGNDPWAFDHIRPGEVRDGDGLMARKVVAALKQDPNAVPLSRRLSQGEIDKLDRNLRVAEYRWPYHNPKPGDPRVADGTALLKRAAQALRAEPTRYPIDIFREQVRDSDFDDIGPGSGIVAIALLQEWLSRDDVPEESPMTRPEMQAALTALVAIRYEIGDRYDW
jgi:hypothetical protein